MYWTPWMGSLFGITPPEMQHLYLHQLVAMIDAARKMEG